MPSVDGHAALCSGQRSSECREDLELTIVSGERRKLLLYQPVFRPWIGNVGK